MTMVYAAIGGMQLKAWTGYFKIILPTLKVLKAAKKANGCVHADTFKAQKVFFAISVWEDTEVMREFAQSGLHKELAGLAGANMSMFHNYTHSFETVPSRDEIVECWMENMKLREGKGSVGTLRV